MSNNVNFLRGFPGRVMRSFLRGFPGRVFRLPSLLFFPPTLRLSRVGIVSTLLNFFVSLGPKVVQNWCYARSVGEFIHFAFCMLSLAPWAMRSW